ncbi:GrpB family protein [Ornithinibacillus sp. 179-J 7C1 HS]|uniref:GrpB family protein n=1 Tax=Ornithinibacillus sp. 179-J 7C1 HS TaxID=3142384 RepID=UPI0039A2346E
MVPYNPNWIIEYEFEAKKLKEIFGKELLHIYHIGSTSIPGMVAKPIIDILVEVQDIGNVDSFNKIMMKFGYLPRGENGISGRRYFQKESHSKRTHHVHIYQAGAKEISQHLVFRDYLIEFKKEAEKYKNLKLEILQSSTEVCMYQQLKAELITNLTANAIRWASKNRKTSVMGYIVRENSEGENELLTLSFPSTINYPYLRVPGGGVEDHEQLMEALYREIKEETGLTDFTLIRKIGVIRYYKPFIKRMVERHDFLLSVPPTTASNWTHKVSGEDKDAGLIFEYKWIKSDDFPIVDGELRTFLSLKHIPELFKNKG